MKLIEMNILVEYCRKGRWEAAAEYAEGREKLNELFDKLRTSHALQRAKMRAKETFGMELPESLVRVDSAELDGLRSGAGTTTGSGWLKARPYLDLELSLNNDITWVASAEDLRGAGALDILLAPGSVVGIDLEWRDPSPAALLQLGTSDKAVLFDLLPLNHTPEEEGSLYRAALVGFFEEIFRRQECRESCVWV